MAVTVPRDGDLADADARRRPALIALDVDGTVLRSDHTLAPATVAAVHRAHEAGIAVVLASSRPPLGLLPQLRALGLLAPAMFVASQGALVGEYDQDGRMTTHASASMGQDDTRSVVEAAGALGMVANWYAGQEWYVDEAGASDPDVVREAAVVGFGPQPAPGLAALPDPQKLLLITPAGDTSGAEALRRRLPAGVEVESSNARYLEVTARGVDKALGVAAVARRIAVEPADVAAIGDGRNDLAMFRMAGLAVAMGNAVSAVLEAADWVAATNDQDGVAVVLDRLAGRPPRD